jgi:hypothetical protein
MLSGRSVLDDPRDGSMTPAAIGAGQARTERAGGFRGDTGADHAVGSSGPTRPIGA